MITATLLTGLMVCVQHGSALSPASSILWDSSPATNFKSSYPIGNGRLGATVFGGIKQERVALNEDSLWNGGYQARVNSQALSAFPTLVSDLNSGKVSAADQLWDSKLSAIPSGERNYQPVGNLALTLGHGSVATSYNRTLDLTTSLNQVSYVVGGTKYTRQAIANYPLGVLGFRYISDVAGGLSIDISLQRDQGVRSITSDLIQRTVTLRGKGTNDDNLDFTAQVKVVTSSGTVSANSSSISVRNSQEVIIYFDAESAFRYPSQTQWEAALSTKLNAAGAVGWDSFYSSAVADYQGLASRVSLDLGNSGSAGNLQTITRLSNWKSKGNVTSDPEFLSLAYNYGRFLLIGSSRPGSLPANLQGVWNEDFFPNWGSKFTININTEMNYWPAETTNLGETHQPLFDHLARMQTRGQYVAKSMYGLSGWVCHHNTDVWGDCAPQDSETQYSANAVGGAWICQHLIEHYRFSGNKTFASEVALPIIRDSLTFYYGYLILKPDGYYATSYGSSPENKYIIPAGKSTAGSSAGIDQGTAFERQILYELFKGFIELSEATSQTDGVSKAQSYLSKIKPPGVGSLGQILEWSGDYTETQVGHRHLSNLVAVYPGSQISPLLNTSLSNAALVSINRRINGGSGNMGWSRAWAAGIYARLLQGNNAVFHACALVSKYLASNLFDLNSSTFQIDGNLGLTAALTEVFLQSHTGIVHLAPALPSNALPQGSVTGLVARGGFVVNITWTSHRLSSASVTSQNGGTLKLMVENGKTFNVNGQAYTKPISTTSGQTYSITV